MRYHRSYTAYDCVFYIPSYHSSGDGFMYYNNIRSARYYIMSFVRASYIHISRLRRV